MKSDDQKRFSKIILAVDGSEHSMVATRYLTNLPISPSCKICVLTVLDTPHTPRRQLLLAALEQACDILREKHTDIEYGLLHGHPAASLVDFANDYRPDLIVMGAKGLRATLGILLGGVAQQVAEYAHWPVLVIRPLSPPPHRILIALDGSEYSQALLDYCCIFPLSPNDEFHLVHVIPPLPQYDAQETPRIWQMGTEVFQTLPIDYKDNTDEINEKYKTEGNEILEQGVRFLASSKHRIETALLQGDASTEILNYSQNNSIDIIAVGSRGLSEVKGWLLGSVSRKLVHYSPCSVLIVKRKDSDKFENA
ncbi:MAG: hypothetical protein C3F13_14265 [Anaerolineales bacterium]|nr:universal stress protein [Anaerolineae bacterium]PWB51595.1 MAG: hypothetical protein C3F13_14265 [Anaerolineales bacterium]